MDVRLLLICALADEQKEGREEFLSVDGIAAKDGFENVALQLVLGGKRTQRCGDGWEHGGSSECTSGPVLHLCVCVCVCVVEESGGVVSSPGSGCLAGKWPRLQRRGTSVGSTASCSEPGRRGEPAPPPRPGHRRPAARTSAGAARR